MNTLNLFKSIKNISYLTALACLPLSSAYGETTPQEIIEAYANDQTLCKASGNVLAYKNINGDTIVLKSGDIFASKKTEKEKDVKVVSLTEVIQYTAEFKSNVINSPEMLDPFGNCCKDVNDVWYKHISSEHPYNNTEPCVYIGDNKAKNLHQQLNKFRHTEIQVQALWRKYSNIPTNDKKFKNKNIRSLKYKEYQKQQELRKRIETFLPIALTDTSNSKQLIDHNIYSLFEACQACRKTEWLQGKERIFMFKVVDSQVAKKERVKYRIKNGFMSQKDLKEKITATSAKDIESQLFNNGFEKLNGSKPATSAKGTVPKG